MSADVLAIVLDYLGEGPIAFPELQESIVQAGVAEENAAIDLAQRALLEFRDWWRARHSRRAGARL
ncbi:MAG: hypothetical protein M3N47_03665 [Chloroflexota bacterium]|nr:hypothetical protein [Chloroflexota bacterium]